MLYAVACALKMDRADATGGFHEDVRATMRCRDLIDCTS